MSRSLNKPQTSGKSRRFPLGQPNCRKGQSISQVPPVMQFVKGLLKPAKSARELAHLTEQPRSICEKTLCGNRAPNAAMYEALFSTRFAAAAVVGLIPANHADPRIRELRSLARKIMVEQKAELEIAAIDAGIEP